MKRREGFTLLELLLAVSLSSVIILGLYSALQTGILSYDKIERASEVYQTARVVLNRMETDFKNSYIYSQADSRFKGSKAGQTVEFCSVLDIFDKAQSYVFPCRIKYELSNQVLKRTLYRGLQVSEENPLVEAQELSLVTKELVLEFAYLSDDPNKNIEWQESWPAGQGKPDQQKGLPLAVKIKLSLIEKDKHGQEIGTVDFSRIIPLPLAPGLS